MSAGCVCACVRMCVRVRVGTYVCMCVCVCVRVCGYVWQNGKSIGEQKGKEGENFLNQGAPVGPMFSSCLQLCGLC